MKYYAKTFAAVALVLASAPAFANSQLIASAGLSPAEAQGLTLTEIAQYKFNREASSQDRQAVDIDRVAPEVAARRPLNAVAVASANASESFSDKQWSAPRADVTMASRSVAGNGGRAQLIASAGLTPEQAEGMTLTEIAQAKFNRDSSFDDRQTIVTHTMSVGDHSRDVSFGTTLTESAIAKFNRMQGLAAN